MAGALAGVTGFSGVQVGGAASSAVSGGSYPTGIPLYAVTASVVTVVATTATATKSTTTTFQVSGATVGDVVLAAATSASGLSAGLTVDAWVSAADQVTLAYSNVSTANAAQIATPFRVVLLKVVA